MSDEKKPQPADGFDENKSQGSMPRPYEHIDRVDLWVRAQRQQYDQDRKQIEELKADLFELKQKEYYPGFAQAQIETYKERLKDEVENTVHLESIVKTLKEQIDQLTKELASVSEQRDTYRDHVHKFRK